MAARDELQPGCHCHAYDFYACPRRYGEGPRCASAHPCRELGSALNSECRLWRCTKHLYLACKIINDHHMNPAIIQVRFPAIDTSGIQTPLYFQIDILTGCADTVHACTDISKHFGHGPSFQSMHMHRFTTPYDVAASGPINMPSLHNRYSQ